MPRPPRLFARPFGWFLLVAGWGAYLLFFSPLWGPFAWWKALVAVLTGVGLGIGFAVGDLEPRQERRARLRFRPGKHTTESAARWPVSRRVAGAVSGLMLVAIGIGQGFGFEIILERVPLLSGLCLLVSCMVGGSLFLISLSGLRRRRARSHAATVERKAKVDVFR